MAAGHAPKGQSKHVATAFWSLRLSQDSTCYVTVHSTALRLWDVARLRAQCSVAVQAVSDDFSEPSPDDLADSLMIWLGPRPQRESLLRPGRRTLLRRGSLAQGAV